MSGTAVESVPGGLIERLLLSHRGADLAAVQGAAARSAFAEASTLAEKLPDDEPAVGAWRRFAWDGRWLTLPDGAGRPLKEILGKLIERPKPSSASGGPEERIVGRLLSGLVESRTILRASISGYLPEEDVLAELHSAVEEIDKARTGLADREDLLGQLDLLTADMAMRARQPGAWDLWHSARRRLTAAGDARGEAAAMLVAGDWHAAPLTSPLLWNCLPETVPSNRGWARDDLVELQEFTGGDLSRAESAYDEAAARYQALGDEVGSAAVTLRRVYLAVSRDRPAEAMVLAGQARCAFEKAGRPLDVAMAAVHGALAAIADGRFPEEVAAADLAVELGRARIGQAPVLGLAVQCARVGRMWIRKQEPDRATAALSLAERIFRGLGERHLRARTLMETADVAVSGGDVVAARATVLEALAADSAPLDEPADPLDARRTWRAEVASRLRQVAAGLRDLDGMESATAVLRETLEPLRSRLGGFTGHARQQAELRLWILDDPLPKMQMAVYRIRRAQDDGDEEGAARSVAEARLLLPELPAEERDLNEAVIALYEGDLDSASDRYERYLRTALSTLDDSEFGRSERRARWSGGLAFHLNAKNPVRARTCFDALVRTATPWWSGLGQDWEYLELSARLCEQEGALPGALKIMDEALEKIESTRATLRRDDRKRAFFGDDVVQNTYLGAIRIALKLTAQARAARDERAHSRWSVVAFDYAERARARALLDLIMAGKQLERTGLPPDLVARWRSASAEVTLAQQRVASADRLGVPLGDLPARLAAASEALRVVEVDLRAIDPRFAELVNPQAEVAALTDVAAVLPESTVLVQYAVGRHDLLAWAITRDGMVAEHQASGRHGLGRLVEATVDACAHGEELTESFRTLSGLLLEPLRSAIEGNASLLVVPAGPALRLPFGVLPWNGAPLAESLPLTVLPSASVLCRRSDLRGGGGAPLVVGDPEEMEFGGVVADPLPGSRVEAVCVARRLPGATLLTGKDATEDRVRAALPGAPVIHLATHGVLDPEAPLASAILLAFGENLSAAELVGQRVDADLVVLSACHTGTGEVVRNDELLGLGRMFLASGAGSVVVTLWAVDDLSAALLMAEFHRCRSAGESDPKALQTACRLVRTLDRDKAKAVCAELLSSDPGLAPSLEKSIRNLAKWSAHTTPYTHPRHWAPFVLLSVR